MIPLTPATDLGRKKSLIRQDRNRIDQDHPNFHYRQHAQNMAIFPSTTGNDPIYEGHEEISDMADPKAFLRRKREDGSLGDPNAPGNRGPQLKESAAIGGGTRRLQRRTTRPGTKSLGDAEKRRRKSQDALRPPSLWNIYCSIITLWAPGPILARLGKPAKAQQRAWREKIGLVSIILMICAFVGFITFGFTQAVCDSGAIQFTANHVSTNYMIFHGLVYNMEKFRHPGADGVPAGSRPIYDLAHKYGGQDGSFLFQNVNGACKGLITSADNSDVPTDAQNNLAWYFPCVAFNQDGSSPVNTTIEYYLGYACHTVEIARTVFYQIMRSEGQVSFTWDDVNNSTRDLTVYGGNVLDLSLLDWFNSTQVNVDPSLRNLRKNPALRGKDLTRSFQTPELKQLGQCLTEITRVGSIDTESVGCIASQVVLYVSLVFILAIVLSKFFLALAFQWFFSRRFAASKSSMTADPKKRAQEIEDWTQDIYRPPPRMVDSSLAGRRGSLFLPKTSRFTSPYAASVSQSRPSPTTMASQSTGSRLIPPAPPFRHADESDPGFSSPGFESRSSLLVPSDVRHSTVLQDGDDGSAPKSS
jgi:chitin synthase